MQKYFFLISHLKYLILMNQVCKPVKKIFKSYCFSHSWKMIGSCVTQDNSQVAYYNH